MAGHAAYGGRRSAVAVVNRRAFTLIELIVSLAIVGMVFGLSVPMFASMMGQAQTDKVVGDLVSALRTASQEAIFKREPLKVVVDLDESRFWVSPLTEERRRTQRQELQRGQIPYPNYIEYVRYYDADSRYGSTDQQEIRFWPDGTCDGCLIVVAEDDPEGSHRTRYNVIRVFGNTGQVVVRKGEEAREIAESGGDDFK
jgi:prepilin-type N-terminal cleavage/methylation domain-containing protein